MAYTQTCQHCGSSFTAQRSTARFCRPACRVSAHYQRQHQGDPVTLAERLRRARVSGVFPYLGSKGTATGSSIMRLIADQGVPCDRWLEPFCGSCAAYLEALKAGLTTPVQAVLNDATPEILITLRTIRQQAPALARALACTPIAEQNYQLLPDPNWTELETAVWWLQRHYLGFCGAYSQHRFTVDRTPRNSRARRWLALPGKVRLLAEALRGPTLVQADALDFIRRWCDGTRQDLLFLDPPYPNHERDYKTAFNRHAELADLAAEIPAALVVVTLNVTDLTQQLYPESRWVWHSFERVARTPHRAPGQGRDRLEEVVLIRRKNTGLESTTCTPPPWPPLPQ